MISRLLEGQGCFQNRSYFIQKLCTAAAERNAFSVDCEYNEWEVGKNLTYSDAEGVLYGLSYVIEKVHESLCLPLRTWLYSELVYFHLKIKQKKSYYTNLFLYQIDFKKHHGGRLNMVQAEGCNDPGGHVRFIHPSWTSSQSPFLSHAKSVCRTLWVLGTFVLPFMLMKAYACLQKGKFKEA